MQKQTRFVDSFTTLPAGPLAGVGGMRSPLNHANVTFTASRDLCDQRAMKVVVETFEAFRGGDLAKLDSRNSWDR